MLSCTTEGGESNNEVPAAEQDSISELLVPFHQELDPPLPGEWLSDHEEPGQSFDKYVSIDPIKANAQRDKLYICKIGSFDSVQNRLIEITSEYLSIFYQIEMGDPKTFSTQIIPEGSRRMRETGEQFHTKFILYNILEPNLPEDAAAFIGFTATDLFPQHSWNYVFGQASVNQRVGIWSFNRFGDPHESKEAFDLCLLRTLKTASHEVGHMFSMKHCIYYDCIMNGSNHLEESDSKPVMLCPVCWSKMDWNFAWENRKRFIELEAFWRKYGFDIWPEYYRAILEEIYAS